jgi:hypothetical protein
MPGMRGRGFPALFIASVGAACAAAPLQVRLEPTGGVIYKIDDDLGHEGWDFAAVVAVAAPDIDGLRVEHRARERPLQTVLLEGAALRAYRDGDRAWRHLHFRLPAAAGADTVEVTLLAGGRARGRGRAHLVRFAQSQRFRLPVAGCWLVSSGHDFGVEHRRHYSRGHFAWDLVRVEADGRPARGPALEDHLAFGQPVLAPGPGKVVLARGDFDDVAPGAAGARDRANVVVIDHGHDIRSRLMHLKKGSLRVAEGDHVYGGQVIAAVGNSGASEAPHLHLHFERADGDRELPLPVRLSDYTVTWNQAAGAHVDLGRPRRGQFVCAEQ